MLAALVNERVDRAGALSSALARGGLDACVVAPPALRSTLERLVAQGATRVAVAGGDGTVAAAAAILAGTPVELAVIPGGTLNHFATDHGVPVDTASAVELARSGTHVVTVDVGRVNGQLMLSTSAVGAYAGFVRHREWLEEQHSYRVATIFAALRTLRNLRPVRAELEVEGRALVYHTPLLFLGVGERELRLPTLGGRVAGGRRGLHVLVARHASAWRFLAAALLGATRGIDEMSRARHVDAFLVDRCRVHLHRRSALAIDGELVSLETPLEYRIERDALRVVVPAGAG